MRYADPYAQAEIDALVGERNSLKIGVERLLAINTELEAKIAQVEALRAPGDESE